MKLSLFRWLHKTESVRWLAKRIPPRWCFLADLTGIVVERSLYPHASRSAEPLKQLLIGCHDANTVGKKCRDYLLFRRWQNHVEIGWENWAWRVDEFVRIEGGAHLADALKEGHGAVLLSGHYYGLDRMVDPILAQKGFAMTRWANPLESQSIEDRWGHGDFARWQTIDFRGDAWHHTQMLLNARKQLRQNRVIHLSIRGQPQGEAGLMIENRYRSFFLESKGPHLLEMLKAPVLPCFAIGDDRGVIIIKIYPAVQPDRQSIMASFGALYSEHINEYPELSRVWRRMMRGDSWW